MTSQGGLHIYRYSVRREFLDHNLNPLDRLVLLGRRRSKPLVFPRVLATHQRLVSCSLTTLPEALALLADDAASAERARLHGVVLLATAPSANHAVSPLDDVVFSAVVALVARVHLVTTREAKPTE